MPSNECQTGILPTVTSMTQVGETVKKIQSEVNLTNDQLKDYVHKKARPRVRFSDRPLVFQLAKKRSGRPDRLGQDKDQSLSDASPNTTTEDDTPVRADDRIKRAKSKVASGVPPSKVLKSVGMQTPTASPVLFGKHTKVTQSQDQNPSLQQGRDAF